MRSLGLPPDMEQEVNKLAAEYPITLEEAKRFYLMGGYDHAIKLIEVKLRCRNIPNEAIQFLNQAIWEEKNRGFKKELKKLNMSALSPL